MNNIIEIRSVSKRYKVGAKQKYYSFREVFSSYYKSQVSKLAKGVLNKKNRVGKNTFWALKDVSLNIREGEIVGIIGRNGAGKSTLLKLLSRITPPTKGEIKLAGRVASLLEVGTGFHQELTGRENIFLNGAILGMKKKEVVKNFDNIVEFSEIGKFIDTPVKHYSSGMYARLAFSVAAHLESEILVVDEVLSVGDASFQKKCLRKMGDVVDGGRTVIFVSHNMGMIKSLCKRCVLLDKGRAVKVGSTKSVVDYYLGSSRGSSSAVRLWKDSDKAPGDATIRLKSVKVVDLKGKIKENFDIREPIQIEIEYWNLRKGKGRFSGVILKNEEGITIFQSLDINNRKESSTLVPIGTVTSICKIPGNFFSDGKIFVDVLIGTQVSTSFLHVNEPNAVSFRIEDNFKKGGVRGDWSGSWPGLVRPMLSWSQVK